MANDVKSFARTRQRSQMMDLAHDEVPTIKTIKVGRAKETSWATEIWITRALIKKTRTGWQTIWRRSEALMRVR